MIGMEAPMRSSPRIARLMADVAVRGLVVEDVSFLGCVSSERRFGGCDRGEPGAIAV